MNGRLKLRKRGGNDSNTVIAIFEMQNIRYIEAERMF